jgi:hypothetical protein
MNHPNVTRSNVTHPNTATGPDSTTGLAHRGAAAISHAPNPNASKANTSKEVNTGKPAAPSKPNAATSTTSGPNNSNNNATKGTPPGRTIPNAASNTATPNASAPNKPNAPNAATPSVAGQGAGNRGRNAANEQARAQIYRPGKKPVLQNPVFANLPARDPATRALAHATFRGQFAELRERFRDRRADRFERRAFVLGWAGPVFWPYAYADLVDYTIWPYANDTFWPYAYDDVYVSIFGPYAPQLSSYASVSGTSGYADGGRRRAGNRGLAGSPTTGFAEICTGQQTGLTDWPIERIAQQVQVDDTQRALLDKLKDATANAVEILRSACPTDLPSTPTGRLAAVRQRIQVMLQATQAVRPALEAFFQSLSDEQKERFIALDSETTPAARRARSGGRQMPDLAQACGGAAAQAASLPAGRIEQTLHLDEAQLAALENLNKASAKAADLLSKSCPQDQSLTPPGRLVAMEQRLSATLQAIDIVQPALAKFYASLNDEQKARFDRLPPPRRT